MTPARTALFFWLREKAGERRCLTISLTEMSGQSGKSVATVRRAVADWLKGELVTVTEGVEPDSARTFIITERGAQEGCSESTGEHGLSMGQRAPMSIVRTNDRQRPSTSVLLKSSKDDGRCGLAVDDAYSPVLTPCSESTGERGGLSTPPIVRHEHEHRHTIVLDPDTILALAAAITTARQEATCPPTTPPTPILLPTASADTHDRSTSPNLTGAATPPSAPSAPATPSPESPEATTREPPTSHEVRVLAAATDGLATGESPPRAEWLAEKHGIEVLEQAVSVTAWTAARKTLDKHACATILHYLDADKIPGLVPLTLRALVRDLRSAGLVAPPWIAPHLVGLEPAPVSEAQAERERAKVAAKVHRDVKPENIPPRSSSGPMALSSLVSSLIPQRRTS